MGTIVLKIQKSSGNFWDSPECSKEGPCPFSKGDNQEIAKMYWWNIYIYNYIKYSSSELMGQLNQT